MKLFKVTLGNSKCAYVVADNSLRAEEIYISYLNEKDWFFYKDRYVSEVLFMAETGDYPLGGIQLFIQDEVRITPPPKPKRMVKREGWMWVGKNIGPFFPSRVISYLYDSKSEAQAAEPDWSGFKLVPVEWEEEE
ncbi:hypothetical protein KKH13_04320 [Patescibacteria group bacterium]|nr:hypothetical protein [Patescibacteria group bacterium]